ncbi:PIN domain-containing protein [Rhodocaloribacter sp.]
MRVLFDTNVLLDVLLRREPFVAEAGELVMHVEQGRINGLVCATTVTTLFYVGAKQVGASAARAHLRQLMQIFEVAPVNRAVIEDALALSFGDFEDAVLHEAARHARAEALVTRNTRDFEKATLHVYAPGEMAHVLRAL